MSVGVDGAAKLDSQMGVVACCVARRGKEESCSMVAVGSEVEDSMSGKSTSIVSKSGFEVVEEVGIGAATSLMELSL